jgi:hypothetical protein
MPGRLAVNPGLFLDLLGMDSTAVGFHEVTLQPGPTLQLAISGCVGIKGIGPLAEDPPLRAETRERKCHQDAQDRDRDHQAAESKLPFHGGSHLPKAVALTGATLPLATSIRQQPAGENTLITCRATGDAPTRLGW